MSLRMDIRNEVLSIHPFDELEIQHQKDIVDWIYSGADLFRVEKPDVPPKHLVSYFALIDEQTQKILLVDHLKAKLWLPSGGHVEPDEHPRQAAERECLEELNVQAVFLNNSNPLFVTVAQTVNNVKSHIDVSLWYVLAGSETMEMRWDAGEFAAVGWKPIADVASGEYFPDLRRFCTKLLE